MKKGETPFSQFYNFCQEACSHCQLICDPVISLKNIA